MRILKNNLKYIFCILALGLIIDTSLIARNRQSLNGIQASQ